MTLGVKLTSDLFPDTCYGRGCYSLHWYLIAILGLVHRHWALGWKLISSSGFCFLLKVCTTTRVMEGSGGCTVNALYRVDGIFFCVWFDGWGSRMEWRRKSLEHYVYIRLLGRNIGLMSLFKKV